MKYALILCLFLTGCCETKYIYVPTMPDVPAHLLVKCEPLPKIGEGKDEVNMGDLMLYNRKILTQATECAIKDDALVDIYEQAKNKQER